LSGNKTVANNLGVGYFMGQISHERQKIDVQSILLILEKITNEKPLCETTALSIFYNTSISMKVREKGYVSSLFLFWCTEHFHLCNVCCNKKQS